MRVSLGPRESVIRPSSQNKEICIVIGYGFLCFFVCSALLVAFDIVHAVNAKKAKAAATAAGTEEEKTGEETTGASGPDESPAGETAPEIPAEQGFDIASLHGGDGEDGDADGAAD